MYWLVVLLGLETVLEGLICGGGYVHSVWLRKVLCALSGALLLCTTIILTLLLWRVWVWTIPFSLYRLINLLRIYKSRLPVDHLRTVSVRAFGWLVIGQILILVLASFMYHFHFERVAFDVLVALQLLVAVTLLRASTHTWSHAGNINRQTHLTDKELPALSVLIPARNETDDLDICLQHLTSSDYPKLEILVLDDCSANRHTPEIIRSFAQSGVRFLQGKVPDESQWLAKNFAYDQLARKASGDLLLFCGVDALLEPSSIRQLVELMMERKKDMVSVLPLRQVNSVRGYEMLQAMRYYWEICLPRRFFKRPPVLSTCWLIKRDVFERMGGFESVARSVSPEATFARQAVVTDAYSFIRSDDELGIYSDKAGREQYETSVRVRYPQLHRRLELVAATSLFELTFLLGPLLGLFFVSELPHTMAYVAVWSVALVCLFITYGIVTLGTRLTNPLIGWLLMPISFALDLYMLHVSLWKYEFGEVQWKGRNVCVPVMQIRPKLPGLK